MSIDIATFGETMALFLPRGGGVYQISYVGAESNVAVALARLGHAVRFAGAVGADELGRYIATQLEEEGVSTMLTFDDEYHTGIMLKEERAQETRVLYYRSRSPMAALKAPPDPALVLRGAAWLHVSGITPALSATCQHAVNALVRRAKADGIGVSFDVNYRPTLWPSTGTAMESLNSLFKFSDVIFIGEDEAEALIGGGSPEHITSFLGIAPSQELVVKHGPRGATAVIGGEAYWEPARAVEALEVTGAGDAFAAGYLSGHLRQAGPSARLRLGNLLASYAIRVRGDLGDPVTEEAVIETLNDDGIPNL